MFLKLEYPEKLIDSTVFSRDSTLPKTRTKTKSVNSPVRIILTFKDQKSADSMHRQLSDLGKKIDHVLQPVFTSTKISEDLKVMETKTSLVNQQGVVYEFKCSLCDANYMGYTSRHLHLCIEEHKYSIIRARNNSRSMDNVRNDWGVDRSTFRLADHVDRSHSIVLKIK